MMIVKNKMTADLFTCNFIAKRRSSKGVWILLDGSVRKAAVGFCVSIRSVKSSSGAFLRRPRNFSSFHRHFPSTFLLLVPASQRRFANVASSYRFVHCFTRSTYIRRFAVTIETFAT